ncbi:MAG TPA: S53 family peptidase [Terriglobia bacterium]|nr:S53 family peptidase [Terriglobia bacterium]
MKFHVIEIPSGSTRIGPLAPDHPFHLTVVLAQKSPVPPPHSAAASPGSKSSNILSAPRHMTHAQLAEAHGAASGSVEKVRAFAEHHGLAVTEVAAQRRTIRLSGLASAVERAFKTRLEEFEHRGARFFAPTGAIEVPDNWQGMVEIVLGLHNSRHSQPRRRSSLCSLEPSASVHDLARAYHFPEGFDGAGQTIGLIEFGGGFHLEDIERYCHRLHIPVPRIYVVKVGKGDNRPAERPALKEFMEVLNGSVALAAGADETDSFLQAQSTAEVTMDLEILVALAPASHIVVYFAPSDEQGLYQALSHAIHGEQHKPSVLSISWSFPEHSVTQVKIDVLESLFREAAHLGICICASSGDGGAMNGSKEGPPSVNYPASSPNCLSCGGTSGLITPSKVENEVVWNTTHFGVHGASGGGISSRFHVPAWQKAVQLPAGPGGTSGRGVPDVAGLADPRYGCEILMSGHTFASAGTSAVAPMWAALIARFNQALGRRCGDIHPYLYAAGLQKHTSLRPIVKGHNGYYQAGEGWNACTGYGTPHGDALLAYLQSIFKN